MISVTRGPDGPDKVNLSNCMNVFFIPPATKLGGYTGITQSVCLSVGLSVDARAVR